MNMKRILCSAAFLCGIAGFAAEPWEDPSVNAINRLPARAISIPCEREDVAFDIMQMERPKGDSRWILPLNGEWDFKWKSATAVPDWEKTTKILVPGCWQLAAAQRGGDGLQGDYDPPLYTNVKYPIEKDAPRVTKEPADKTWTSYKYRNPVGLYTTTFKRPWRWWFRRTILHFNGVSSAFKVRVNGQDVGYGEDSRLPSEFDLTPYLKTFGENTLEVEVHKHSDGSYLEDQDFWRLSGIFREVYLVSERADAPYDLVAETTLSDDLRSGSYVIRDEKGAVLAEKKLESVTLFDNMIDEVNDGTISVLMRVSLPMPDPEEVESARAEQQPRRPQYVESHGGENYNEPSEVQKAMQKAAGGDTRQRQPSQPIVNQGPKIGRNDPCPCGSGKKYKNCHGKGLV